MIKKKRCPNCGREIKSGWNFCPYCGYPLRKEFDPFRDIEKQMEGTFGIKIPRIELTPKGIKITVTSTPNTYKKPVKYKVIKPVEADTSPKISFEGIKETIEPKTEVKHLGYKDVIEIHLPGVKSMRDIQITQLEQSIEIKARVGDKLYFKLLPIPPGNAIKKSFSKGKLRIEIVR